MERDDQAYTILIEMLGWYCRDFIVVTIHVFQRAIVNALEIDGKVESLSREREDILKRYGIIRTEKYSKWKKEKNLTGWFNSKEEINFKKLYRASRNYGKITKRWTFKDILWKNVVLKIFEEIMAPNIAHLVKNVYTQIEVREPETGLKWKKSIPRHVIINLTTKIKKKILKATREKWHITYKGTLNSMVKDFSSETMEERWKRQTIPTCWKKRIVYNQPNIF